MMKKYIKIVVVIIGVFTMNACDLEEKGTFYSEMDESKRIQTENKATQTENLNSFEKARSEFFVEVLKIQNKSKKLYPLEELYTMSVSKSFDNIVLNVPRNKQEFNNLNLPPPPDDAQIVDYTPVIIKEKEAIELEPKYFGVIGEIQGLAMEAKLTGNDTKLINYLKKNNLYDISQKISYKYKMRYDDIGIDDGGGGGGGGNVNFVSAENLRSEKFIDGDIFLKYDKSSSGSSNNGSGSGSNVVNWIVPGHWGHAAFLDVKQREKKRNYFLLSASNETDQEGVRVGYDRLEGYWSVATEVAICRVKNQPQYKGRASIEYSKNFIGKKYSVTCKRMSNSSFYCSKVVYRGWLSQGVELEPHNNWFKVFEFWRWNYRTFLGKKIRYPEFRTKYIKDPWVTPSDLYDDNDVFVVERLR